MKVKWVFNSCCIAENNGSNICSIKLYFRNSHHMNIVHFYQNDEYDSHREQWFHIDEPMQSVSLRHLKRRIKKQIKQSETRISIQRKTMLLTTIITDTKIFGHLDSSCLWIFNKVPCDSQSFTVTIQYWSNSFIVFQWSCHPTRIRLIAELSNFVHHSIHFEINLRRTRMWLIMCTKSLKRRAIRIFFDLVQTWIKMTFDSHRTCR